MNTLRNSLIAPMILAALATACTFGVASAQTAAPAPGNATAAPQPGNITAAQAPGNTTAAPAPGNNGNPASGAVLTNNAPTTPGALNSPNANPAQNATTPAPTSRP